MEFLLGSDIIHIDSIGDKNKWGVVSLAHEMSGPLAHDMSGLSGEAGLQVDWLNEDLFGSCDGESDEDSTSDSQGKQISWLQAAQIIRVSDRQLRRWRKGWEKYGYDGLFDRRLGKPSPKRVPVETVQEVLRLYREKYSGFSVQHYHEKLVEEHQIHLSYSWVKKALQEAELVQKEPKRGAHRKKRERRPIPGMLLHIDASKHQWIAGQWHDLIVILDDATSEVYYAQLVEEEFGGVPADG